MKRAFFIFGLLMLMAGYITAQEQKAYKKVAEGNSNTPFGKYTIEIKNEPVMLEGEEITSYRITYEKSPISIVVLVDKEKECKNYIVTSNDLSVMYTCNGQYFGVNKIDRKYEKEGYVTDDTYLDRFNYFHQKLIVNGNQNENGATQLIASYFPLLIK